MRCRREVNTYALFLDEFFRSLRSSKKMISTSLKHYRDYLAARDITLKDATVLSAISRAKAKGLSADDFLADIRLKSKPKPSSSDFVSPQNEIDRIIGEVYQKYERSLRQSNSLDFDDLLLFGLMLFKEHSRSVKWCRHVLVDEL